MNDDTSKKASNVPYVIAVVVMALLGVVFALGVTLIRPDKDNTQLITTIIGFLAVITTGILTFLKSDSTHTMVNSQLSQWKADFANLMRAQGAEEAVTKEQARVAEMKAAAIQASGTAHLIAAITPAAVIVPSAVAQGTPAAPVVVKIDDSDPVAVKVKESGAAP